MDFSLSAEQTHWRQKVSAFLSEHVYPGEVEYRNEIAGLGKAPWHESKTMTAWKSRARAEGLWNLFMPPVSEADRLDSSFAFDSPGLSNLQYALCAETMGRLTFGSEIFNCSAPDAANMELLHRYGTREQKEQWLRPLMEGAIRSAFMMTEPAVASSDANNIATTITRQGDMCVIQGRKWWSTGLGNPRCKIAILFGRTQTSGPRHNQHGIVLIPTDTPGFRVLRMLPLFGFSDAPRGHAEVELDSVTVPAANMILGEGRGFEIAQGRLGPGRIHHCMRAIGAAESALDKMVNRLNGRSAFGALLADGSIWQQRVAEARVEIEMTRLLCLKAADKMDREGNKSARLEIAMAKVAAPRMALKIIDNAIQAFGAAGLTIDAGLAQSYATIRALRIVDGPDEVHNRFIARKELDGSAQRDKAR